MATIAAQKELDDGARRLWLWEALVADSEDGAAVELPSNLRGLTVEAVGSFNTGTVTFQGSLNGTTWWTLQDPAGNNLAFTAAGGGQVANALPRYIRPLLSGEGTDDIDARAFAIT